MSLLQSNSLSLAKQKGLVVQPEKHLQKMLSHDLIVAETRELANVSQQKNNIYNKDSP